MIREVEQTPRQKLISYFKDNGFKLPITDDSLIPSAAEIAPEVDLTVRRTSEAIANLRRIRKGQESLLPPADPENTSRRASTSLSIFNGGKWLTLKRYSFCAPEEAYQALVDRLGEERLREMGLSIQSIRRMLPKHSKAGPLKHTEEETRSIHKTIKEPKEIKRGRAIFWARVIDALEQQNINSLTNRMVWMDIWRRSEDVADGVKLVVKRMSEGQKLIAVLQQFIESRQVADSLLGYVRREYLGNSEGKEKKLNGLKEIIQRIDSLPVSLTDKVRLFQCIVWEERGAKAYGEFFGIAKEKVWQSLKKLIDGDMDQLHAQYDSLPSEKD